MSDRIQHQSLSDIVFQLVDFTKAHILTGCTSSCDFTGNSSGYLSISTFVTVMFAGSWIHREYVFNKICANWKERRNNNPLLIILSHYISHYFKMRLKKTDRFCLPLLVGHWSRRFPFIWGFPRCGRRTVCGYSQGVDSHPCQPD